MLALCQHNGATYYAQNYAGIIGASLGIAFEFVTEIQLTYIIIYPNKLEMYCC